MMITVKVTFEDGDSLQTDINTTLEGARRYYLGQYFNLGTVEDRMVKAVKVEQILGTITIPENWDGDGLEQ